MLVAAGRGERLGDDRPKAFARLGGLPLLAESLRRLDDSEWIDGIVVVAPPEWEEPSILVAEELGASKVAACVTGGATRSASVRIGLAEVPDAAAVVLVHDAARPLLPADLVERLIAALGEGFDGAIPGLPVTDTVKRVRDGIVIETPAREELFAVQTPQAFVASVLRSAAAGEGSDCASLVEAVGGRIKIVAGDEQLLKITKPEDLRRVEAWLAAGVLPVVEQPVVEQPVVEQPEAEEPRDEERPAEEPPAGRPAAE
ncbi:MAG TPA: 2-C-methyl-D-erythritol 4-phosphate cytidylyltransferase [Gaiellaceae bacterium]